ncbi:restriction endonuclease subunit S [Limosilactobacillus reuteri]|uniref:restriction endonuclease subunit S n=1 Tax=Limosilactobacillus reuteri TaxID=1598 RepID=UPI0021CF8763|nr:restriction endonuclease subunit S [Limosilactobacillus reuteri]MCU4692509.1 restriction endonuclease subunit S [Limosilactobacillus reuteri]
MDKQPEKLVPEVRFKGFTDDWEQHKFDNVVKRVNDKDDNPKLPHIEFENIISGNGTLNKNIKDLNSKKIGTKFQKEDILFGKLRPYLKNWYFAKENGIAVGDFWVLRAKEISVFVYYLIQTEKFYSIANLSSGSKMPRSDWNLVSNSRFNFPKNTIESIKIGNLILQLDRLITLQQRKLEQLKQLKTAMLQQLFVNKNYKQPILRFKNFNSNWEKRKFSELATIRRGLTYKPKDVRDSGKNSKRVLRSSNINENSFVIYNDDVFVDKSSINIAYVHNNDILITAANGSSKLVGKHALIHDIPDNSAVHGGFMLLASSNNPEFINALMSSPWYSRFVNNYVIGGNGAIGNLKKDDLDSQIIYTPAKNEIKKIGHFFNRLDNLIALQQNKLTQLTTLKEYLLQKLFI